MKHEPTTADVLSALNKFSHDMDGQLQEIRADMGAVKKEMVTKAYLDNSIAGLRVDLGLMAHKLNTKLSTLVEKLVKEGSLKRTVADQILAMEPFVRA